MRGPESLWLIVLVSISLFPKGGPAKCTDPKNYRHCFHFYGDGEDENIGYKWQRKTVTPDC